MILILFTNSKYKMINFLLIIILFYNNSKNKLYRILYIYQVLNVNKYIKIKSFKLFSHKKYPYIGFLNYFMKICQFFCFKVKHNFIKIILINKF